MMSQLSGIVLRIPFIVYVTLKLERSSVLPTIFRLEILSYLQNKSFAPARKERLFNNFDFKMSKAKFGALGQILIEIPKSILKLFRKILKEKYTFTQSSVLGLRNLASALMLIKETFIN